jgi:excisionase family DNA binding protein
MTGPLDPYAVLGVDRDAGQEEIRRAFRRLARRWHPDANPGDPSAPERFKGLVRAYEILLDPRRRRAWEGRGASAPHPGHGPTSILLEDDALYHSDLGHYSDFYGVGDPLTVAEAAALIGRHPDWLRRMIRLGVIPALFTRHGYLLRRRDVERLDRERRRRRSRSAEEGGRVAAAEAAQRIR